MSSFYFQTSEKQMSESGENTVKNTLNTASHLISKPNSKLDLHWNESTVAFRGTGLVDSSTLMWLELLQSGFSLPIHNSDFLFLTIPSNFIWMDMQGNFHLQAIFWQYYRGKKKNITLLPTCPVQNYFLMNFFRGIYNFNSISKLSWIWCNSLNTISKIFSIFFCSKK